VIGGEAGGLCVIAADKWEREIGARAAQIDDGHFALKHHLGDGGGIDADEDSVAFPIAEPFGGRMAEASGMKIEGPAGVLAIVARDSAEKATAVGAGGFDQKSDVAQRRLIRGGGGIFDGLELWAARGRARAARIGDGDGSSRRSTSRAWIDRTVAGCGLSIPRYRSQFHF